jgi:helicase
MHGAKRVEPLDQLRFRVNNDGKFKTYNLDWKSAETSGDIFLRKDDKLYSAWLDEANKTELSPVTIEFDYSGNKNRYIAFFDSHIGLKGMLSIDKVSYEGIGEEEHLIFTVKCDDGTLLDEELINSMMELRGTVVGNCQAESDSFIRFRQELIAYQQQQVEENNKKYYLEECDKLDAYSEDLKEGLKRELKDLKKAITEKNKEFRASTNLPLSEMLEIKDELEKMKKKRRTTERDINKREDEIDEMNERLQNEIREKLKGNSKIIHIMTIGFKIK